nr:MAG TPA: hypothetical protein [Caudoviricetes sp.]
MALPFRNYQLILLQFFKFTQTLKQSMEKFYILFRGSCITNMFLPHKNSVFQ